MKISKTTGRGPLGGAQRKKKSGGAGRVGKGHVSSRSDNVDKVDLSSAAIAAAGGDAVEEVVEVTEVASDTPLPDPYETSKKMLEKEFNLVFRDTYLADGR